MCPPPAGSYLPLQFPKALSIVCPQLCCIKHLLAQILTQILNALKNNSAILGQEAYKTELIVKMLWQQAERAVSTEKKYGFDFSPNLLDFFVDLRYSNVSIIRPGRSRLLEFKKKILLVNFVCLIETFSQYPYQVV